MMTQQQSQQQERTYRSDIKVDLCSSYIERHQSIALEGFPFKESNEWNDFCDNVDRVLRQSFMFLNYFCFVVGLPSLICIILSFVNNDRSLGWIGLGLIVVELVIEFFASRIVVSRMIKRIEEEFGNELTKNHRNVHIKVEKEGGDCKSICRGKGEQYYVNVIVGVDNNNDGGLEEVDYYPSKPSVSIV